MSRWMWIVLIAVICPLVLLAGSAAFAQQEQEKTAVLVTGLDGGVYEAYSPALIEKVQKVLKTAGLYQGEVSGTLDEATMKAIGDFQKENDLKVSGVPTPNTRKLLFKE